MILGILGFIVSSFAVFAIMVGIETKIQRKQKQELVTEGLVKELDELSEEERNRYLKKLDIELEYKEYKERHKQ